METLEAFIDRIGGRGYCRSDLIRELVQRADELEDTTQQYRRSGGFADVERLGRIVFFLRHGVPATRATDADLSLCNALAAQLRERGEWP